MFALSLATSCCASAGAGEAIITIALKRRDSVLLGSCSNILTHLGPVSAHVLIQQPVSQMFRQQQRCCPSPACSQSTAVLQARIWLPEPAMKHMACLAGQAQVAQICKSCVVPRSFMPTCSREVHSSSQSFLSCYCKHWAGLAIVLAAMPAGALKARGPKLPSEAKLLPVPHMPCVAGLSNDWPPIAGLCPWVSAAAAQCWKAIVQVFSIKFRTDVRTLPSKWQDPAGRSHRSYRHGEAACHRDTRNMSYALFTMCCWTSLANL